MALRNYSNTTPTVTLSAGITDSDTTISLSNGTDVFPSAPFTLVIDPDGADEEVVEVTTKNTASNFTVTRGVDGTTGKAHGISTVVIHGVSARDFAEANSFINATPVEIGIACSDETSDLAVATGVATFRLPYAMTLTGVRATVNTAPTGSTIIVDINEGGTSVLSTKLSIDASEKTSTTAATAAVISDSALADDAEITVDIDQIGSTVAGAGLKVWLIGTRA
jgi:hypothetical protein